MKNKTDDPIESREIEQSLKTDEDIRYWKEVKENNKDPIIVINDD